MFETEDNSEIQEKSLLAAQVAEALSVDYASIYLFNLQAGKLHVYSLKNDFFRDISRRIGIPEGQSADGRSVLSQYAELYVIAEDRALFLKETEAARIREHLAAEESFSISYRCHAPDGGLAYVSMTVSRSKCTGADEQVIMGFRDVTENMLALQRELAATMEAELALEREKHANEVKSQFLFNVSHDIRTPLNAITGFAGLAKRHIEEPERLNSYLDRVEEASAQLLELIDDLLEMSKLQFGRIELKSESCRLHEQIDLALDMFRAQAEEKQLILRENIPCRQAL